MFFLNNSLKKLILLTTENNYNMNLDDTIQEFQKIPAIKDPVFWLATGLFICFMAGLIFADLMRTKLNKWSKEKESPLPLENPRTILSWFSFFSGLTIIFSSAFTILNFSSIKSIIFSNVISILFGITMWKAIKDLLTQLKEGTIKEIDQFL